MWQQIAEDRSFIYEFNGEYRTEHDGKKGNFYGMYWTFNGAGIFKTKDKRYQLSWKNDCGFSDEWGTSFAVNEAWIKNKSDTITVEINGIKAELQRQTDWGKGWVTYGLYASHGDIFKFKENIGKHILVTVSW